MHNFEELQNIFNRHLEKYIPAAEPVNLKNPVKYTLAMGGKRLRPVLLLMAGEIFGSEYQKALPAATAIEIFHNSTLIHDDIMDEAELRRNQQTVHKQWNRNTAILSGDLMIIEAYSELNKLNTGVLPEILKIFNKTAAQVCEGQQYDLDFETNDEVTISDYLKMIRLKTSVLLAGALKMGSIIGGAAKNDAANMYAFGENLGMAFQLQDDLLDAFGDTKNFGKKIGGDIVANKKTFLLLKALELAKGTYHDELTALIGNHKIPGNEKISKILKIYNNLDIKTITEDYMIRYFDKAFGYLEKISVQEEKKDALHQVAKNLLGRKN